MEKGSIHLQTEKKKKIEIIQVKKKIENKIKNYLEVIENG